MSEPFIPYGRQIIDDDDVAAVVEVLRGDWLTTGPTVGRFEEAFCEYVGASYGAAVSSGTAALHLAMLAAGIGPGDEVIVPALTFVASANAARYVGATVVFADIDAQTLTVDTDHVASLITDKTKAIVVVDYGGLPGDLDRLLDLAHGNGAVLIEDACHAPGATYQGRSVGGIADFTAFSFHPVKHIATGEGGLLTSLTAEDDVKVRSFRAHGIASDFRHRESQGTWEYDQVALGFNYRIPDITCALGISQIKKQGQWLERRRTIAARYDEAIAGLPGIRAQHEPDDRRSAWHLYPVVFDQGDVSKIRQHVFTKMRADGIGVNVHYQPVYLHTYYAELGYRPGLCPVAEQVYTGLLSLPMWPGLADADQDRVLASLTRAMEIG